MMKDTSRPSIRRKGRVTPLRRPRLRRRLRLPRPLRILPAAAWLLPLIALAGLAASFWGFSEADAVRIGSPTADARVVDGDTLVVRGFRIRIANLDCAERHTTEGRSASRSAGLILRAGERIECELTGRKSYDREIGRCAIDGEDFGRSMVDGGHCGWWSSFDRFRSAFD